MPTMPPLAKSWLHVVNQRVSFVTGIAADITPKLLYGIFSAQLITVAGFTCIGSSTGVTGAGNINHSGGSNTWTSAAVPVVQGAGTGNLQSWIIFKDGNGVEWLVTYQGSQPYNIKISFSPGALWTLNGSNNAFQPTATDEVPVASNTIIFSDSTASQDRVWDLQWSTDKKFWRAWVLRNSAMSSFVAGEQFTTVMSQFTAPLVVGWAATGASGHEATGGVAGLASLNSGGAARINGVNVIVGGGGEGFLGSLASTAFGVERLELQGTTSPVVPVSFCSGTAPYRGKIGNRIDCWRAVQNVNDGTPDQYISSTYTSYGSSGTFPFSGVSKVTS